MREFNDEVTSVTKAEKEKVEDLDVISIKPSDEDVLVSSNISPAITLKEQATPIRKTHEGAKNVEKAEDTLIHGGSDKNTQGVYWICSTKSFTATRRIEKSLGLLLLCFIESRNQLIKTDEL